MNKVTVRGREVRPAAKVIIRDQDNNVIFVESRKSGIFNLPGGGIDPGESPVAAALRELDEEIGVKKSHLTDFALRTTVSGPVALGQRELLLHWTVFEAGLAIPASELVIPERSEIKNIHCLESDVFAAHEKRSNLAHRALVQAGYLPRDPKSDVTSFKSVVTVV